MKTKTFFGLMAFVCLVVLNFTEGANNFGLGQALASTSSSSSSSRGSSSSSSSLTHVKQYTSSWEKECLAGSVTNESSSQNSQNGQTTGWNVNGNVGGNFGVWGAQVGGGYNSGNSSGNQSSQNSSMQTTSLSVEKIPVKDYWCEYNVNSNDKKCCQFQASCEQHHPNLDCYKDVVIPL